MTGSDPYESAGSWLDNSGPMSDVVLSSRIRLARNVVGFRFYPRATDEERCELLAFVRERLMATALRDDLHYTDMEALAPLQRQILAERHVVSRQFAEQAVGRAVGVSPDESLSVMINEEDHLRFQVLASGLQLPEQYDRIDRVDRLMEEQIEFAFSPELGYLTACPTNVGTGIRVSVMLHLPALKMADQMEKVFRAAKDMRLAIRGLYGEGSEPVGDMYQLSNQITLGKTEPDIIQELCEQAVEPIVRYERTARERLLAERATALDDKVFRALGLLRHARMISSEEALYMLSYVRLGAQLGRIKDVSLEQVHRLLQLSRPGHLQHMQQRPLDAAERDAARASFIRKSLGGD